MPASALVPSQWLWLGLGALSAVAIAPPLLLRDGSRGTSAVALRKEPAPVESHGSMSLVICYARTIVDDPRSFVLAWPVFGIAAGFSTIVGARAFRHMNRM